MPGGRSSRRRSSFFALLQDGITTGAIYLLLAIGLLIMFSVTRVIFVPQGDLLAFGALTAATLQSGHLPGTLWLLDGVSALALCIAVGPASALRVARLGRISDGIDNRHARPGAVQVSRRSRSCSRWRSSRRWAR